MEELREIWRQKRVQRLARRLQGKQKDPIKPVSNKILGLKSVNFKMDQTSKNIDAALKVAQPVELIKKPRQVSRSKSLPKIIPRETKLSQQRKSMLDPDYKLKKILQTATEAQKLYFCDKSQVRWKPIAHSHSCTNISAEKNNVSLSPLVKGLDNWLKKRGKKFTSYANLRNLANEGPFTSGIPRVVVEDHSEPPISVVNVNLDNNIDIHESGDGKDIKLLLEGALKDLCSILRLGYPIKECESWLEALRRQYSYLMHYPFYWECRALINSKMGVKQIDRDKVNQSQVNELVNSLKSLNLDTKSSESLSKLTPTKKNRVLTEVNQENVMNSSTIQFSVKKEKKNLTTEGDIRDFVVTPVRRNARRKCAIHFKDENCVKSLMELSEDIRETMKFQPNQAL